LRCTGRIGTVAVSTDPVRKFLVHRSIAYHGLARRSHLLYCLDYLSTIIPTRFLPMSCKSPFTVPIMTAPLGLTLP